MRKKNYKKKERKVDTRREECEERMRGQIGARGEESTRTHTYSQRGSGSAELRRGEAQRSQPGEERDGRMDVRSVRCDVSKGKPGGNIYLCEKIGKRSIKKEGRGNAKREKW